MSKLNLVILDKEEAYVEGFINYLMCSGSKKFNTTYFNNTPDFENFIQKNNKKINILLISAQFEIDFNKLENIESVIILSKDKSPGKQSFSKDKPNTIYKYQHADKLISSILEIYARVSSGEIAVEGNKTNTKIIGFFSPLGGTGKTSMAINCAVQFANRGLSVFYLNLESVSSLLAFFAIDKEKSLSKLFYYIKENNKNIPMKIEALRLVDQSTKIHYFSPMDNCLEYEDILQEEIKVLIENLKLMSQYDVIIIDMSSYCSRKNIAILEACDEVFLVLLSNYFSSLRANTMANQLSVLNKEKTKNVLKKVTIILNKTDSISNLPDNINFIEHDMAIRIPFIPQMLGDENIKYIMSQNSLLANTLQPLVLKICSEI